MLIGDRDLVAECGSLSRKLLFVSAGCGSFDSPRTLSRSTTGYNSHDDATTSCLPIGLYTTPADTMIMISKQHHVIMYTYVHWVLRKLRQYICYLIELPSPNPPMRLVCIFKLLGTMHPISICPNALPEPSEDSNLLSRF